MNGDVVCPNKADCTSFPMCCPSCKNNKGKKDYFEPNYHPYPSRPYNPWKPWVEPGYLPGTWC